MVIPLDRANGVNISNKSESGRGLYCAHGISGTTLATSKDGS